MGYYQIYEDINMKKLKSLTIGISAYNEESNIGKLLDSIIAQKRAGFILESVIIACDGTTDKTAEIVERYSNKFKFIHFINDGKRLGKAKRLNHFYKTNKSDVILTLDADVVLANTGVISEIINKFNDLQVGLVGGCNLPLAPRNFFEKVIYTWLTLWFEIRRNINNGDSIHNNLGCVTALSNELAKQIRIPDNKIPDDDFTYLTAMKLGYKFKFAEKAVVFYRTVDNVNDFFTQHSRLLFSKRFVAEEFGEWVNEYYKTPTLAKIKGTAKSMFASPLFTSLALFLQLVLRKGMIVPKENYSGGYWKTAISTKG